MALQSTQHLISLILYVEWQGETSLTEDGSFPVQLNLAQKCLQNQGCPILQAQKMLWEGEESTSPMHLLGIKDVDDPVSAP